MRALLLIGILLLAGLAGCLQDSGPAGRGLGPGGDPPELSKPVHAIAAPEEVWVKSSVDGKRIHNVVVRPDADGTFPVFVNFSPYWGDTAIDGGDAFARYMVQEYVPRGYIVVLSAVRGTGHSEGCFQIAGDLEVQDAYDVIDFFAGWEHSDGRLAAGGKSYDSTTQNGLIAKQPHEALRGVFHVSGITDMYRYNYVNGVPYVNGLAFTPRYYATQAIDEYLGGGPVPDEGPESLQRILDDAACSELPEHVVSGEGSAASGQKDAYWQERDWNRYITDTAWNGSVFFVHGLQDWNVKPDHILPWVDLLPTTVRDQSIFWLHQDTENAGHVYPMRDDWNQTMLRWLDHILKGVDTGLMDEPAWQVEGSDGVWRAMDDWFEGPDRFPTRMGATDQATYEWEAQVPTRFAGPISVDLTGRPTSPDPVLTVVVEHNGQWVTEGVLRGIYRNGLEEPAPLMPGTTYTFTVETYPVDLVLQAGDKLTIRANEPTRHAVAPTPGGAPEMSEIRVRLATAPALFIMDPQPPEAPCFAC